MSEGKHRLKKILKWLAGITCILLLIGGAASWYISVKYKPAITQELKRLVLTSTDSLYHIDFSKININFLTGTASISNVVITPDTNVYNQLVLREKAPDNIYQLKLAKLAIRSFHPWRIYAYKKLNIGKLLFQRPQLVMINKQYAFNEDRPPRPRKSMYDFIEKLLKEVRIEQINFTNVSFKYINKNEAVPEADSVHNLNIYLTDYLVDKNSSADTSRLYLFKAVQISLNNYSYLTPDSMYRIGLEQLNFLSQGGRLTVKKFLLEPQLPEMQFGRKAGFSKDRFDIKMNDISLQGMSLPLFVRKRELFASSMKISNGSVAVFSDNSLPKILKDKTGHFPHQLLQQLKYLVTIKKIMLQNVDVSYSEYDRDSRQRGMITFDRTAGTITNATNAKRIKLIDPVMKADFRTWLMNKGPLQVHFKFNQAAPNGAFSYEGQLKNMEGKVMNKITKPLGMIEVNRGDIKNMSFKINATSKQATGSMALRYNDLSVKILRRDTANKLVRQGLISFLANNLVINSDNPGVDGKFTRAPIRYIRPATSSFFSYIWRTLFTGIKYSVGVTPAREEKILKQIAQFEQMKEDRNQRREAREKRKSKFK